MTIKATASCRGHHAVRACESNNLRRRRRCRCAVRQVQVRRSPLLAGAARSKSKPLPNLNAQSTAGLGVLDEKSLGFVNFVGNRQYITLGNLSENTKAQAAISRGPRCHLSQLDTRGKMSPSQRRAMLPWRCARFFRRGGHQQINNICHFPITKMLTTK
jgi:hypothetical protein